MSPLHSRGSPMPSAGPTKRNKLRNGCLNFAFPGALKRAGMLRHPHILRDPQRQVEGAKSEMIPNKTAMLHNF